MALTTISITTLEKFPSVNLNKQVFTRQKKRRHFAPASYKLIPLSASGEILEPDEPLLTRVSFWKALQSWKHVAVYCETKQAFLSCPNKIEMPYAFGAIYPVAYRSTIGHLERFEIQNRTGTTLHSLRSSHNGLHLVHLRNGGLAFRAVMFPRMFEIAPELDFSTNDPRVKFVGVIDNSKRVVMKLQPNEHQDHRDDEEERMLDEKVSRESSSITSSNYPHNTQSALSLRDNNYTRQAAFSVLQDILQDGLLRRTCTHFHTDDKDCHYYVRDKHGVVYMVVVAEGFSRALAGECINDLRAIYKKFTKRRGSKHLRRSFDNKTYGKNLRRKNRDRIENELRFLVWNYNEHNESICRHPSLKKIFDHMEEAIDIILNSKNDGEVDLEEKIRYFNGLADRFRKYMRILRSKQVSKWEHAMERACDNIMGIGKTYTVARGSRKSVGVFFPASRKRPRSPPAA